MVNQNDDLRVHVYNGLGGPLGPETGTALHSHGNFFNGTNYYDGPVGVTQCPIPPGSSLTYHIPVDLQVSVAPCRVQTLADRAKQTGTYWIHVSLDRFPC